MKTCYCLHRKITLCTCSGGTCRTHAPLCTSHRRCGVGPIRGTPSCRTGRASGKTTQREVRIIREALKKHANRGNTEPTALLNDAADLLERVFALTEGCGGIGQMTGIIERLARQKAVGQVSSSVLASPACPPSRTRGQSFGINFVVSSQRTLTAWVYRSSSVK